MKPTQLAAIVLLLAVVAGCSPAVQPPDVDAGHASPVALDYDSKRYFEESRHLFDYNPADPIDLQPTGGGSTLGVTAYDITYASPKGGRVPATLLVPEGTGPFAGILLMHGMPSERMAMLPAGTLLAQMGAVVVLIDAPFARPENKGRAPVTYTEKDREEQIQLIVDLRRAVDVLLSRPEFDGRRLEVDPDRLAYFGVSYGGAMGGLLAGVEERIGAYVLVVGDGGLVTHMTGPEDWPGGDLARLPEARRQAWLDAMWPIEPIHFVSYAFPASLLFQNGTEDPLVPPGDALRYQSAGSEPKSVVWYDSGHGLPPEAFKYAVKWLEDQLAAGSLLLVATSFRQAAVLIDRLLLVWLALTLGSLIGLLLDASLARRATWPAVSAWALVVLFFGPPGLLAYLLLDRRGLASPQSSDGMPRWQRALGSTLWAAARYLPGAIIAVAITSWLPVEAARAVALQFALALLLPLATGLVVYACIQRAGKGRQGRWLYARRPLLTELVAVMAFAMGAYPVGIVLGDHWLAIWFPINDSLANPAGWSLFIIGAWAGAATGYLLHWWLIRRGWLHWGPGSGAQTSGESG